MRRSPKALSRREREIMDVLWRLGQGTVAAVRSEMEDPPGYDAVRTTLRILKRKGFVTDRKAGAKYVYWPTRHPSDARRDALDHLVTTFFDGSPARAALDLLRSAEIDIDDATLRRLEAQVEAESD